MDVVSVSISQLKTNPSRAIFQADDYPVVVRKRNEVKAYLVGKDLFEKVLAYLEDYIDKKAVRETDFKKGKDFEKVAKELGL